MVSPGWDRWVVTAEKPQNQEAFERAVDLPLERFSAALGYGGTSTRVYEQFETVEQANVFAEKIRALGAFNVQVSAPRLPPDDPLPTVDRAEAARRLRDFLSE